MGAIPVHHIVAALGALIMLFAGLFGVSSSSDAPQVGSSHGAFGHQHTPLETASFTHDGYTLVTDPAEVKNILSKGLKAHNRFPLEISADFNDTEDGIGRWYETIDTNSGSAPIVKMSDKGAFEIGSVVQTLVGINDHENLKTANKLLDGGPMVIAVSKDGKKYLIGREGASEGIVVFPRA
ncbi:hypothetical protein [Corynebacterium aquilae]|uniref:Uncharacterized protein n=1 Tax=Corynebacterium aquilae DSM 44791 TaxID=1431546 RepID=A0A1L7CIK8_9CORY|nr:hypothetical protein [Corynebacterium aquilae]APT85684.1 hypothetical protein CAQU_12275 [Corynebacterium aquilae DSM 44791]